MNKNPEDPAAVILGHLIVLLGISLLVFSCFSYLTNGEEARWPTISGTITRVHDGHPSHRFKGGCAQKLFDYEYIAYGERYSGTLATSRCEDNLRLFKGSSIEVRYNPEDPKSSTTTRRQRQPQGIIWQLLTGLGLIWAGRTYRSWHAKIRFR